MVMLASGNNEGEKGRREEEKRREERRTGKEGMVWLESREGKVMRGKLEVVELDITLQALREQVILGTGNRPEFMPGGT